MKRLKQSPYESHTTQYRTLSRRLDRCDRVIQDESGDSNGGKKAYSRETDKMDDVTK